MESSYARTVEPVKPLGEFRIFTIGVNETEHGPFLVTPEDAVAIVKNFTDRGTDLSFDYSHDEAKEELLGPKIAAGWCSLELRDDGIYCVDIRYTKRAMEHIQNGELRYFSPYFGIDSREDGEHVGSLLNCALTNIPATHGITPISASNAAQKPMRARLSVDLSKPPPARAAASSSPLPPPGTALAAEAPPIPVPSPPPAPQEGPGQTKMAMTKAEMLEALEDLKAKHDDMRKALEEMSPSDKDATDADEKNGKAEAGDPDTAPRGGEKTTPPSGTSDPGDKQKPTASLSREVTAELAAGRIARQRLDALTQEVAALSAAKRDAEWSAAVAEGSRQGKLSPAMAEEFADILDRDPAKLRKALSSMTKIVKTESHTSDALPSSNAPGNEPAALSKAEQRMAASLGADPDLVGKYLPRARKAQNEARRRATAVDEED